MPHIAIGQVEATLLKLLHHHTPLYLQTAGTERQRQHTVRLQPETCLRIDSRHSEVIVGYVVVSPGIVLTAGMLQGRVIIRDMHRSPEHEVFKQMGKAGVVGMLVASTHIVDDVHSHHLRAGIFVMYQPQTVIQYVTVNLQGQ